MQDNLFNDEFIIRFINFTVNEKNKEIWSYLAKEGTSTRPRGTGLSFDSFSSLSSVIPGYSLHQQENALFTIGLRKFRKNK